MRERDLERGLASELKRRGCLFVKTVSPGMAGWPDRMLIGPDGYIIFVEMKTDRGRLSDLQKACIARLKQQGCRAMVVYGEEGVHGLLKLVRKRYPQMWEDRGVDPDAV